MRSLERNSAEPAVACIKILHILHSMLLKLMYGTFSLSLQKFLLTLAVAALNICMPLYQAGFYGKYLHEVNTLSECKTKQNSWSTKQLSKVLTGMPNIFKLYGWHVERFKHACSGKIPAYLKVSLPHCAMRT